MDWSDVNAQLDFETIYQTYPGEQAYADGGESIRQLLHELYDNSPNVFRPFLNDLAQRGKIRFLYTDDPNQVGFAPNGQLSFIRFSEAAANSVKFINQFGRIVTADPSLVLAHELYHYANPNDMGSDGIQNLNPARANYVSNSSIWDDDIQSLASLMLRGSAQEFANRVAVELQHQEQVRPTYAGTIEDGKLDGAYTISSNLTNGGSIDSVRIGYYQPGSLGNSDVDEELDFSLLPEVDGIPENILVLTLGGSDVITSGHGANYLYGMSGSDYFNVELNDKPLIVDGGEDGFFDRDTLNLSYSAGNGVIVLSRDGEA